MTFEEKLDQLRDIVHTLASSVVAHDNKIEAHDRQIEGLIRASEAQTLQIAELTKVVDKLSVQVAATERQWQAYINTLPK